MRSFAGLIDQTILVVPSFTLDSGKTLREVPVAYKTWGVLNPTRDNVMVICHAFTGSADVEDWWGPLMGPGKAFDPTRFFIFCANIMGSPYGSASPVTINPGTGEPYGPDFPQTNIRDDVRLHKLVLDHLDVASIAVVIGGSMGGMAALEWPLCTPTGYVRNVVPLATCARHSAWCISWGEAQRQSIYADPAFAGGRYTSQPAAGLGAARMAALLTYRSRQSFESRFGRTIQPNPAPTADVSSAPSIFSAQSYLRYQGDKFTARFDANCYIHITYKLDSHDVSRGRTGDVLALLPPRALVIGIESDGLFDVAEQREIAAGIPGGELVVIVSPEGHDGFLLEFEQINKHVLRFLRRELPQLYAEGVGEQVPIEGFEVKKTSVFGEAEADVARW